MLILLKRYMFNEVMRYLHDNNWKPIKCILRPIALFTNKAKQAFIDKLCYIVLFVMMFKFHTPEVTIIFLQIT